MTVASGEHGEHAPPKIALVALSTLADCTVNYPLWIVAKRLAAGIGMPKGSEVYKGVSPVFCSLFLTTAGDEVICRHLRPLCGAAHGDLISSAFAGALVGMTVTAPTENIVTRAHATGAPTATALRDIFQEGGVRGLCLPQGQAAIAVREVSYAVGIFSLRDRVARWMHEGSASSGLRWWADDVASALTSAVIVNTPGHPSSVVLAQQQAYDLSLMDAVKKIYSTGGLRGFYAGFWARCASLGGSLFVVPPILAWQGFGGPLNLFNTGLAGVTA